jgi:hypothetical protein
MARLIAPLSEPERKTLVTLLTKILEQANSPEGSCAKQVASAPAAPAVNG